ncbi:hypothetical protein WBG78_21605 [Chryseolinea sp. T2]|uniref:hypothetical protein n=1 Tax=Chryseolinea sp. T2 TaxID=3129255 RepID=UPI0030783431
MTQFIELQTSDEIGSKSELINVASIGRAYESPQNTTKSIVELNYQSVHDAPVYLEVDMPYDRLRALLLQSDNH